MNPFDDMVMIVEALLQLSMIVMVGLYFAFSNTIMTSLKRFENGADVMVEINKVILNPLFMMCFILSGVASVYFVFNGDPWLALSGGVFVVGTTLVTIVKNVPLNNKLLATSEPNTRQLVWSEYLDKWVFWNQIRTVSALLSGLLLAL